MKPHIIWHLHIYKLEQETLTLLNWNEKKSSTNIIEYTNYSCFDTFKVPYNNKNNNREKNLLVLRKY